MKLSNDAEKATFDAAVEEFVDGFYRAHRPGQVGWCIGPSAHRTIDRTTGRQRGRAGGEYLKSFAAAPFSRRGLGFTHQAGALFASQGGNPQRALNSVYDARGGAERSDDPARPRGRHRTLLGRSREARGFAHDFVVEARRSGFHPDPAAVHRLALAAARALYRAEAAVEASEPGVIVVATQHATNVRAVLATAHERDVPTVYFPHAPVQRTRDYEDLPVSFAGLRGRGEVDHYRGIGVSAELDVVGNPTVSIDGLPSLRPSLPPVLALSPDPPSVLADLIGLVGSALEGPVTVAPHPRTALDELRSMVPPQWQINPHASTQALLAQGPPCLIQHSSGVAWESLAMGIPTVQLNFGDALPPYPLIREPEVSFASSTGELEAAMSRAYGSIGDTARRRALVAWAQHWCELNGSAAAEACAALVDRARESPGTSVIYDAWRNRGQPAPPD